MNVTSLFKMAIGQEIEARDFYKQAAEKVTNPGVREIFKQLSLDEAEHERTLSTLSTDKSLAGKFIAPEIDYKIAEGAATPVLSTAMKPADAIMLAVKKEQEAVEFYTMLAKKAKDQSIAAMLQALAAMELGHKQKLENAFVQVGYPESF